ncbi:lipopolysaccharide biosynthesis protein [Methylicorpusculum sp.]|uniref:lipopolysaccharide biosynthesis protein n=1 Tax=Methylicorpusculum sp. TaxID=2713644 RepID=UPI0027230398|nr:polysaccharide biosynthesis C-terminal domain-containing protein [Methylicorpusculum sp.]MDO8844970.1 polysaccharide biosynthesis C-terminal domain-containing protein [Methylicorpusculum sp.]
MNPLRQLISQTAIYGLSSILGRFLNYLLVPLYTYTFSTGEYGVVSEFYAYAGFFAVVLTSGLETGYFRFRKQEGLDANEVYTNALCFLVTINILFVALMAYIKTPAAEWLHYPQHPEYLIWFSLILALDAITALPFARLRAENRAWRFAGIKMTEILLTIGLNLFFLLACPKIQTLWPDSLIAKWYDPAIGVGYIFLANLVASGIKLALLYPQFKGIRFYMDRRFMRTLLSYSLPMIIIGFAGMVNEMLDRAILKYMLPYDLDTNLQMLGIYGACYKLSILMTLFVQAFRYAGEPFFFNMAGRADAKRAYAMVMNFFVLFGVFIFLVVTLYIGLFKYFIGEPFREGLKVVPILLIANLFLGIYVNLSIWYKLTDRTGLGAWVSIAGAGLTAALNFWWIPLWGYEGSAWATLACYAFMVFISWLLGRHYYPIDYPIGKVTGYLTIGILLYLGKPYIVTEYQWNEWLAATLGLTVYIALAVLMNLGPFLRRRKLRQM